MTIYRTPRLQLSREEWAERRRTAYGDDIDAMVHTSRAIDDYFTPQQKADLIAAFKALYVEEGRKLAKAKAAPGAFVHNPGETEGQFTMRWLQLPLSDDEKLKAIDWQVHQQHRKGINKALKLIAEGEMPFGPRCDLPPKAKHLLEAAWEKYEAADKAAHAEAEEKIRNTPIDDAAWEEELRYRAEWEENGWV